MIMICPTKDGGCGHVSDLFEWKGIIRYSVYSIVCPRCGKNVGKILDDSNFDSLTDESNKGKARRLLDEYHKDIHGGHLRFFIKEGFISKDRLTPEQRAELELV